MNYQVDWNGDGNFENVMPDGYGMHEDERHGANLENVIDGAAHLAYDISKFEGPGVPSYNVYRVHNEMADDSLNPDDRQDRLIVTVYPTPGMPDHSIAKIFSTEDELAKWVADRKLIPTFDDDYDCSGCWDTESGDCDVWFAAIFEQGAEAARCGHGCVNQYEYTAEEFAAKRRRK